MTQELAFAQRALPVASRTGRVWGRTKSVGAHSYYRTPTEQVSNLSLLSLSRWPRNWCLPNVLCLSHHQQFTALGWTHSMGTQSIALTKHATNHSLLWSLSDPEPLFAQYTVTSSTLDSVRLDPLNGTESTVLTKHATNHVLLWSLSDPGATVCPVYCHTIISWQC